MAQNVFFCANADRNAGYELSRDLPLNSSSTFFFPSGSRFLCSRQKGLFCCLPTRRIQDYADTHTHTHSPVPSRHVAVGSSKTSSKPAGFIQVFFSFWQLKCYWNINMHFSHHRERLLFKLKNPPAKNNFIKEKIDFNQIVKNSRIRQITYAHTNYKKKEREREIEYKKFTPKEKDEKCIIMRPGVSQCYSHTMRQTVRI